MFVVCNNFAILLPLFFVTTKYPFTTVVPNLGVWIPPTEFDGGGRRKSEGVGSSGLVLCVSHMDFAFFLSTLVTSLNITCIRLSFQCH